MRLVEAEVRFAEHALDFVGPLLFDLEADVCFPALFAGTFVIAMLAVVVLWRNFSLVNIGSADVAVRHCGCLSVAGHCSVDCLSLMSELAHDGNVETCVCVCGWESERQRVARFYVGVNRSRPYESAGIGLFTDW